MDSLETKAILLSQLEQNELGLIKLVKHKLMYFLKLKIIFAFQFDILMCNTFQSVLWSYIQQQEHNNKIKCNFIHGENYFPNQKLFNYLFNKITPIFLAIFFSDLLFLYVNYRASIIFF